MLLVYPTPLYEHPSPWKREGNLLARNYYVLMMSSCLPTSA